MAQVRRVRTKKLSYLFFLFMFSYIFTVLFRLKCTEFYKNAKNIISRDFLRIPEDVSCYSGENIDDKMTITPGAMYLISTSCDKSLSIHRACVLESVLHSYDYTKTVYFFVTKPVKECGCSEGLVKKLKGITTLKIVTIQIDKFVEGTPLQGIFKGNFLNIGLKRHSRVAEILKMATMFKYGGVVIDIDMIIAKPVIFLGMNWGVRVKSSELGSAIFALSKHTAIGRSLISKSIELLKNQSESELVSSGLALTEAFRYLCYDEPARGCSYFKIYDTKFFYPFNRSHSHMMFKQGDLIGMSYGYYMWDTTVIRRKRGSVYDKLMREYCPNIVMFLEG